MCLDSTLLGSHVHPTYLMQESSEVTIAFGQGSHLRVITTNSLKRNLCCLEYHDWLIFYSKKKW